jgi:hypothetical protein
MAKWLGLDVCNADRAWPNPANTSVTEWWFAPSPFNAGTPAVELVRFNDFAHLMTARIKRT